MVWRDPNFITLHDLYVAYRKAKKEAYYDPNCAHGLKFSRYEQDLTENLDALLVKLKSGSWCTSDRFIGTYTYIPKSIKAYASPPSDDSDVIHFCVSDPLDDWTRIHSGTRKRATAEYRLVIDATVNFMIVSALWVIKVGHKYDACLDTRYAMGSRLRRHRSLNEKCTADSIGDINENAHSLFQPYFSAYGKWRQKGLQAMRTQLEEGNSIVAVTMDLEKFYHNIDPGFLLDPSYLEAMNLSLNSDEILFTDQLMVAMEAWREKTPDQNGIGIPVGLTASSVIANVLLKEFDTAVIEELMPVYYGRYVDDVFLVIRPGKTFPDGAEFLKWLAKRLQPKVTFHKSGKLSRLRLNLPYGGDSDLTFAGNKQKIFQLEGHSGLDLLQPIIEKIREQSSEYRLLPELPDDESDMASRALLVTPDATLDADALRKADSVMLRRMGFSLLLSDIEDYARDLEPATWQQRRKQFYGLAERHLLSPRGIFDFYKYLPRIVGLMVACRDWDDATCFFARLSLVKKLLEETTESGNGQALKFWGNIRKRIYEAILQSRPIEGKDPSRGVKKILSALDLSVLGEASYYPPDKILLLSTQLKLADWGRTSYAQLWINGKAFEGSAPPDIPANEDIYDFLKFSDIYKFQHRAKLQNVYWPAVVFPTRPLAIAEMTRALPVNLMSLRRLRKFVLAFRGAWMPASHGLTLRSTTNCDQVHLTVPDKFSGAINVAVTNLLTSSEQWKDAIFDTPDLSLDRYDKLNHLLNRTMQAKVKPSYVVLPECSMPRKWMMSMARKLAVNNISLLCGLEYQTNFAGKVRNDALVSLTTNFAGYPTHICFIQPKLTPAWAEGPEVKRLTGKDFFSPSSKYKLPIYIHRGFQFGLLLCSDFTDIRNRSYFQGWVDALFVLEWNQDITTFSSLVESGALDMHAFVIQANNRRYGDSRIRGPYKEEFKRDLVRLKGGIHDYFVIGEIKYEELRDYQSATSPDLSDSSLFKPFPIGFEISPQRRGNI